MANPDEGGIHVPEFTDDEIRDAFQTFDFDKNMFIGVSEIKHVLKLIGEKASDDEVDEMIRLCDTDGSGQVSFDGFYRLFAAPPSHSVVTETEIVHVGKASAHTSQEYSGTSIEDLLEEFSNTRDITPVYIRKVYRRFQQFDHERSGRVGYTEFLQVLETDDSPLMKKLFDVFDFQLFNEIEMKPFLVNLIINSRNSIKLNEKLKISFALMRLSGGEDNSLRKSELTELMRTLFIAFPNELTKLNVEQRVEGIFRLASMPGKGSDTVISFDQFMDTVGISPEIVLPPSMLELVQTG